MQSNDNKIIKKRKLNPPHSRSYHSSEPHRASRDQKQGFESNKINQAEIDREFELSEALLFQVNLAHLWSNLRRVKAKL